MKEMQAMMNPDFTQEDYDRAMKLIEYEDRIKYTKDHCDYESKFYPAHNSAD